MVQLRTLPVYISKTKIDFEPSALKVNQIKVLKLCICVSFVRHMLFIRSSSKLHADTYGINYTTQVCQVNITASFSGSILLYVHPVNPTTGYQNLVGLTGWLYWKWLTELLFNQKKVVVMTRRLRSFYCNWTTRCPVDEFRILGLNWIYGTLQWRIMRGNFFKFK